MSTVEPILDGAEVVVCLGPGGVGKTTTSAAIGIAAARAGRRVVVLTIDPARRLADAMGLSGELGHEPVEIALDSRGMAVDRSGVTGVGSLWAAMLDPQRTFTDVINDQAESPAQAERITSNPIFANLTTSLSGTNEYMASERLWALHHDPRWDLIVIDTPPSRHAVDFLDSPTRLVRFIDHPLYRYVLAPRRGLLRAVNAAAQLVVKTIGRVVGARLLEDVVEFFAAFQGLDRGFRARSADVEALLGSDQTAYVLVTSARAEPLHAVSWIRDRLNERKIVPAATVFNRVLPPILATVDPPTGPGPLDQNLRELALVAAVEATAIEEFVVGLDDEAGDGPVVLIEDQPAPVHSMQGLELVASEISAALLGP